MHKQSEETGSFPVTTYWDTELNTPLLPYFLLHDSFHVAASKDGVRTVVEDNTHMSVAGEFRNCVKTWESGFKSPEAGQLGSWGTGL